MTIAKPATNGHTAVNGAPPVNVLLMLSEHLPRRHREVLADIAGMERRIGELRAEVSRLEKHAAIEGIDLTPPAPTLTLEQAG